MPMMPGARLGVYEIVSSIGAGGMGEVYRGRDTKLQRDVAIKVLPALFATDPDRLARFEREAQVLAALNHPNIAQIYGVEEAAGTPALVMELVEGPTLADAIAQRRPSGSSPSSRISGPDWDPLSIARQIAEALEAAHEQGIIHRDLKPQNIKLHQPTGLWKVDAGGGKPRQIAARLVIDGQEVERAIAWPALLPGGRSVLVSDWEASQIGHLLVVDLETRRATTLGIEGSGGQVLPNGYLVYASPAAALMAVPFDRTTLRAAGAPVALIPDIAFGRNNVPVYAFSENGTLVFASGFLRWSRREPMRLVRFSSSGAPTVLPFEPDLLYRGFALSPDGTRLAVGGWDASRWIFDLRRGTRLKLQAKAVADVQALAWSPDGRRLAVTGPMVGKSTWGVVIESLDVSGRVETLVERADFEIMCGGWTPDGRTLICWGSSAASRTRIVRIDEGKPMQTMIDEPGGVSTVRVSPDGQWLAFDSTMAGQFQVYATPISGQGARVAITARGGQSPRWSRDGRQPFFRRGGALFAVDADVIGDDIHFGPERKMFEWDVAREYDVAATGEFYSMEPVPGAAHQTSIQLRTGWFAEVDRLARRPAR